MEKDPPLNSKELERRASTDSTAREELRKVVRAGAVRQAERIIKIRKLDPSTLDTLTDVGISVFDKAFNIYLKYGKIDEEKMIFFLYFEWWARQAIVRYLEEMKAKTSQ